MTDPPNTETEKKPAVYASESKADLRSFRLEMNGEVQYEAVKDLRRLLHCNIGVRLSSRKQTYRPVAAFDANGQKPTFHEVILTDMRKREFSKRPLL